MTPTDPEMFLCQSFTPNFNVNIKSAQEEPGGCDNGEFCLQDYSRKIHDRTFLSGILNVFEIPIFIGTNILNLVITETPTVYAARDGPFYEDSELFAHILIKRE